MSTSIFIKTWKKDIPWLNYCLRSIEKYGTGFDEIVIAIEKSCTSMVNDLGIARVVEVDVWRNGYIQQQWVKLNAASYVKSDHVLFVDSDNVFYKPFTPESFMRDGKPILLKTRYSDLGDSPVAVVAQKWKGITESFVGFNTEWEFMRRLPFPVLSSTLNNILDFIPDLHKRLSLIRDSSFSEFNVIGAFISEKEPENYFITNTLEWMPEEYAHHFWSWGGITQEVQGIIDEALR